VGSSLHDSSGSVRCSLLHCVAVRIAVCCSVVQCGAVCYSVVQCVAVCYSVLQCVTVFCSVLQQNFYIIIWNPTWWSITITLGSIPHNSLEKVCCSVLQCVAVCWSALQCAAVCYIFLIVHKSSSHNSLESVCCSMLQYVAVCCGMLQCGAVWFSGLHNIAVFCLVLQYAAAEYISDHPWVPPPINPQN